MEKKNYEKFFKKLTSILYTQFLPAGGSWTLSGKNAGNFADKLTSPDLLRTSPNWSGYLQTITKTTTTTAVPMQQQQTPATHVELRVLAPSVLQVARVCRRGENAAIGCLGGARSLCFYRGKILRSFSHALRFVLYHSLTKWPRLDWDDLIGQWRCVIGPFNAAWWRYASVHITNASVLQSDERTSKPGADDPTLGR